MLLVHLKLLWSGEKNYCIWKIYMINVLGPDTSCQFTQKHDDYLILYKNVRTNNKKKFPDTKL